MKNPLTKAPNSNLILTILFFGWIVSYIDRTVMSLALSQIGTDMSLDASVLGVVLSSFFMGYALMQIPGGWLADKFGSRRIIVVAVLVWSIFTAFTGVAWSITSLLLVRFIFGIGEGGYPAASTKAISDYFTKEKRTKAQSIMMSSNSLGAVAAPILCAPLLAAVGWRHTFWIIALLGIVFIICFLFATRHKGQTAATPAKKSEKGLHKELLRNSLVWKIMLMFFFVNIASWGMMSWMPTYLINELHINMTTAGYLTAIPALVSAIVMILSGRIMERIGSKAKWVIVACLFMYALCLFLITSSNNIASVILHQSIASLFGGFTASFIFTMPHRFMKEKVVGTTFGMINFGGQAAGIVSPLIMGFMISASSGSYTNAFLFLTISSLVAALVALTLPKFKQVKAEHTLQEQHAPNDPVIPVAH